LRPSIFSPNFIGDSPGEDEDMFGVSMSFLDLGYFFKMLVRERPDSYRLFYMDYLYDFILQIFKNNDYNYLNESDLISIDENYLNYIPAQLNFK